MPCSTNLSMTIETSDFLKQVIMLSHLIPYLFYNEDSAGRMMPHCVAMDKFTIRFNNRQKKPQKLTQLSQRSHPRHLIGKRTAQKVTIIDTTSDNQVNSNFLHWWSPASLTFYNYFYVFLYLYITRITINNNTPHLKSPRNQNRRAAYEITGWGGGGLELVYGRPTLNSVRVSSY